MAGSEVEEGVRNADLVVLVALVFQSVVFCGKHRMDEFLGGGLADTAGHSGKRDLEPAAVGAADFDQRPLSVGDDDAAGGIGARDAALHHRGLGSVCERLSGKVVPVERLAPDRNKDGSGAGLAGIGHHRADRRIKADAAADRPCNFRKSHLFHLVRPPSFLKFPGQAARRQPRAHQNGSFHA